VVFQLAWYVVAGQLARWRVGELASWRVGEWASVGRVARLYLCCEEENEENEELFGSDDAPPPLIFALSMFVCVCRTRTHI
jgi:hypothetical protein